MQKFEILTNYFECSKESIFTIRTTKEGPRKVMLIGSRSSPVIVRDSATGNIISRLNKSNYWNIEVGAESQPYLQYAKQQCNF